MAGQQYTIELENDEVKRLLAMVNLDCGDDVDPYYIEEDVEFAIKTIIEIQG